MNKIQLALKFLTFLAKGKLNNKSNKFKIYTLLLIDNTTITTFEPNNKSIEQFVSCEPIGVGCFQWNLDKSFWNWSEFQNWLKIQRKLNTGKLNKLNKENNEIQDIIDNGFDVCFDPNKSSCAD